MLKANRKTLIITSIVTVLPILIGLYYWNRLPDVMATHFGIDNQPNGFSSKAVSVIGIPLFCLALLWVGAFVTSQDPRRQNISPKVFTLILWIAPVVSLIGAATIYPYNLGYSTDITFFAELFLGIMFVVVGNFLPKSRQNYTVGIKIPWTLANEENWNRTHRLAGYLWVISGILMIVFSLTGAVRTGWIIGIIIVMTIIPCVYSCWLHTARNL